MSCIHQNIEGALDRWTECHWHIHQMEENYHVPDHFRYSLNSFIRTMKEIPQLLEMELQNHQCFQAHLKPLINSLKSNQLFHRLGKQRNFIVHQGMLSVLSSGHIGTTEGRGFKMAIGFNVATHETSDEAYERYKAICRRSKEFRSAFGPDCDSRPCLRREWKLQAFPDTEALELAVTGWRTAGDVISKIVVALGGDELDISFPCRHEPERIKTKTFSQQEFFESVDGIKSA